MQKNYTACGATNTSVTTVLFPKMRMFGRIRITGLVTTPEKYDRSAVPLYSKE